MKFSNVVATLWALRCAERRDQQAVKDAWQVAVPVAPELCFGKTAVGVIDLYPAGELAGGLGQPKLAGEFHRHSGKIMI